MGLSLFWPPVQLGGHSTTGICIAQDQCKDDAGGCEHSCASKDGKAVCSCPCAPPSYCSAAAMHPCTHQHHAIIKGQAELQRRLASLVIMTWMARCFPVPAPPNIACMRN